MNSNNCPGNEVDHDDELIQLPLSPDRQSVLAEYNAVRNEILQLNSHIFTVFSSGLGFNFIILGWMFGSNDPLKLWHLPLIGIAVLVAVNILMLNKNRLAHRLALFQKHFIEDRNPELCWGRVYFKYRDVYKEKQNSLDRLCERIIDSRVILINVIQLINLFFALRYRYLALGKQIDSYFILVLTVTLIILLVQFYVGEAMIDYRKVEEALIDVRTHKTTFVEENNKSQT